MNMMTGIFEEIIVLAQKIDVSLKEEFSDEVAPDEEVVGDLSSDLWMRRYSGLHTRLEESIRESMADEDHAKALRTSYIVRLIAEAMFIEACDRTGQWYSSTLPCGTRTGSLVVRKAENRRPSNVSLH